MTFYTSVTKLSASKIGALKNLASDMTVKLKNGSWKVLLRHSLRYLWKTLAFVNSFIMVIFISKMYFDYMGQESVSKLIHNFKQNQLIIPNHCP